MSTAAAPNLRASDFHPPAGPDPAFYREVLAGLRAPRKRLPCKYFYDETGSALFDRICELRVEEMQGLRVARLKLTKREV